MNEKEKQASIEYILAQGLVKPPTMFETITQMFSQLGWRVLFWDTGYSLFFALLTFMGVLLLHILAPSGYVATTTLIVIPMLFLLLHLFTEISEMAGGCYELKQTMRYTITQVSALRVMGYSLIGVILSGLISLSSSLSLSEFWQLFSLSLGGLFLIAFLSLQVRKVFRSPWAGAYLSALWVFLNILLPYTFGEAWERILWAIPLPLSLSLSLLGAIIVFLQLRQMLKESYHAYTA